MGNQQGLLGGAARRRSRLSAGRAVLAVAATIAVTAGAMAPAGGDHSPPTSVGIYRIPYADGTAITVTNDTHNHNDAYDMSGGVNSQIVAAASGWIRDIVDHNGEEPNPGDGIDVNGNPYDDFLEHACLSQDPADIVGSCGDYNNYVWIEHPNGEYTKYSHLGTGTVSLPAPAGFGWQEGDWIDAGDVIGLENDIGAASCGNCDPGDRAFHLHWEVAVPNDPDDDLTWDELGGFINNGSRRAAIVCDIADNDLLENEDYTANPCDHEPPTADAGGPYSVDEGSATVLDGTGSIDPDGRPLTYRWGGSANIDDPTLAAPTYSGVDDSVAIVALTVYDQVEALDASDLAVVTVENVPPAVAAVGDAIDEGGTATVTATFSDPGVLDTHTATIDWGDGTAPEAVSPAQLPGGIDHDYGDNGSFDVTVTVVDDDGGVGSDTVSVDVGNLDPSLSLDTSGSVSFPGGDFFVVGPGDELAASADGADAGSDDLTFAWSSGDTSTHFNDGVGPDPFPSPDGTFPFAASDAIVAVFGATGVDTLGVTLDDDDGGADDAAAGVIVTGVADATQGDGWWKHQFAGSGAAHVDASTLEAYRQIVNAVSSVFSEAVPAGTFGDVSAVLSPTGGDRRARATAQLMVAWLQFASGAVAWDATVPLGDGTSTGFLDLMASAEEAILDATTTSAQLQTVEQDLRRVRHAT